MANCTCTPRTYTLDPRITTNFSRASRNWPEREDIGRTVKWHELECEYTRGH